MIKFFVAGIPRAMSVGKVIVTKRGSFQERRHNEWALQVGYAGRTMRPVTPLKGPIAFTARFLVPKPKSARKADTAPIKRPDLDNLVHKLTDQWNGCLYEDDSQITRLVVTKDYPTDGVSGVEITVEPLEVRPGLEPEESSGPTPEREKELNTGPNTTGAR